MWHSEAMESSVSGTHRCHAILIAKPGYLRDSLQVVMQATGKVDFVGIADDCESGLKMARNLLPNLIVIDTAGISEPICWPSLRQFKVDAPDISWCMVTHTIEQQTLARQAGVEIILATGISTKTLFDAIDQLNQKKRETEWPLWLEGGDPSFSQANLLE